MRSVEQKFTRSNTAQDILTGLDLSFKTALVTGCNSGLGFEIAGKERDLMRPNQVRYRVDQFDKSQLGLGIALRNEGLMAPPILQGVDGIEGQFFANHLSRYLLPLMQVNNVAATDQGRTVFDSSDADRHTTTSKIDFENFSGNKRFSARGFYGQPKLKSILTGSRFSRRKEGNKIVSFASHSGLIQTNLGNIKKGVMPPSTSIHAKSVERPVALAAATQIYPAAANHSVRYIADCQLSK